MRFNLYFCRIILYFVASTQRNKHKRILPFVLFFDGWRSLAEALFAACSHSSINPHIEPTIMYL